jgi:hypothetical protein
MTFRERDARMRELAVEQREQLAAARERQDALLRGLLAKEREWARLAARPRRSLRGGSPPAP